MLKNKTNIWHYAISAFQWKLFEETAVLTQLPSMH